MAAHAPPPEIVRAETAAGAKSPASAWRFPVPGAVVRVFAYDENDAFARGQHRGADLAAPPGAPVRAACGGRVVTARAGYVVTLRCGPWRVTHLPLAQVLVHAGERVRAGAPIGRLGVSRGHRGLHLGVRRAGDRFGYVDPMPFLAAARPPTLGPPPPAAGPRRAPPAPAPLRAPPAPLPAAPAASRPHATARPVSPLPDGVRVSAPDGLAPWPAWVGLASVLGGAFGGGVRWRARARRARAEVGAREAVP